MFDEFISHGKLFYRGHKRVISSMQSFTKKISKRKGKYSGEIVLYPVNIDEHCGWNLTMHAYFFRCMQIFFRRRQTVWRHSYFVCALLPGNSTDTFTEIYKHTYIYKYMFGSNSHGLAPERDLRPDKFINLASRGINWYRLVSANRWPIDDHTKTVHRLLSIGSATLNRRQARYLSDHPPF